MKGNKNFGNNNNNKKKRKKWVYKKKLENFFLCGGLSHDEVTLIAHRKRERKKECRPAGVFLSVLVVFFFFVLRALGNKVVDWTLMLTAAK
jgi:hypothetical protein